jgi:hypothetical protein
MLALIMVASVSSGSLADRPTQPAVSLLTAAQAARGDQPITVHRHPEPGGLAVAVDMAPPSPASAIPASEKRRRDARRLLDVAADGTVALTEVIGAPGGALSAVRPDGSVTRVALPSVVAGAFVANGAWLAAVDAAGHAWRVNPSTGQTTRLADGPFGGSVAAVDDGSLLLVAVSSPDAPYASELVRFNPDTAASVPLWSDAGFIFSSKQLSDGSIAALVHPFGGGVELVRLGVDGRRLSRVALDSSAVDATVSDDGSTVAYRVGDSDAFIARAGGHASFLGAGDLPRISPDGESVLLLRGSSTAVVDLAGKEIDRIGATTVGWAACNGRCGS